MLTPRPRPADRVCENRAPLGPANSANVCYRGACAYACNSGFAQQGDQCVPALATGATCAGVTCDVPANGYALCNNGACEVGCNLGYTRYSTNGDLSGPYVCIDTLNDATRCGTGANLVNCPQSCTSSPRLPLHLPCSRPTAYRAAADEGALVSQTTASVSPSAATATAASRARRATRSAAPTRTRTRSTATTVSARSSTKIPAIGAQHEGDRRHGPPRHTPSPLRLSPPPSLVPS